MELDLSNRPAFQCEELGISFVADFPYTDAVVLQSHNLVALFIDGWSNSLDFVGKLYDFHGNEFQTIAFPPDGAGGRSNAYWYAHETPEGLRVNFHQQSERDFGGIYSIERKGFLSFHEAR